MPKNKLFKCLNYPSKNYSFYSLTDIFQNPSELHLEVDLCSSTQILNVFRKSSQLASFKS